LSDCLHETMDVDGFLALLRKIESGAVQIECRDLAGPSPLAHAIIGAKPYAFLDDGKGEERRTRSITTQRLLEPKDAADLGRLDPAAIERVRAEAWPEIGNGDELHDALVVHGFLTGQEIAAWQGFLDTLIGERRVVRFEVPGGHVLWASVEREEEMNAARAGNETALKEILRNRLELLGPVTEPVLGAPLGLNAGQARAVLLALEAEGAVMRGRFIGSEEQWCERRLLLRIHRYTRERKRSEIQAVPPAQLMRFLFRWQQLAMEGCDERREDDGGLLAVLQQLEGCTVPAGAWEQDILPVRIRHYLPQSLDNLCSAGRIAWWRPAGIGNGEIAPKSRPVRGTPITLIERESLAHWQKRGILSATPANLSPRAQKILDSLREHGASFFDDLVHDTGLLRSDVEQGLAELVGHGRVSSDSFAGLRALITPAQRREKLRRYRRAVSSMDEAGRWSLPRKLVQTANPDALADPAVDHIARVLLRRYGVVFRKLLERESGLPPWRELFYVYRRLEARGEIRGGRFVSGFAGEQFALPEAATLLHSVARDTSQDRVSISAADPLNLAGIITPGEKVPALSGNRVLFEQGVPVAVQTGGEVRFLKDIAEKSQWEIRKLLIQIQRPGSYHHEPRVPQ
ncbi:MAG: ATP-dependent DNA helicase, partial [Hydrocarboniphaga effusa]|nr:ATP-dependent DNA helicase [Hydrocarboniphaga effusa]